MYSQSKGRQFGPGEQEQLTEYLGKYQAIYVFNPFNVRRQLLTFNEEEVLWGPNWPLNFWTFRNGFCIVTLLRSSIKEAITIGPQDPRSVKDVW